MISGDLMTTQKVDSMVQTEIYFPGFTGPCVGDKGLITTQLDSEGPQSSKVTIAMKRRFRRRRCEEKKKEMKSQGQADC